MFERSVVVITAFGIIGFLCQILHQIKERFRLDDEKTHRRQEFQRAHGSPFRLGRANDRTYRKASAEERAWLRHDQIGLEVLRAKRSREWRRIEIRKHQSIRGVGERRRITRLIVPGLEMGCLRRANAEQDSQDFRMSDPLCERWVEAVATLFD